jgi:two-component system LytT family sensor kinase
LGVIRRTSVTKQWNYWTRWAALIAACSSYAVLNVLAWFPATRFKGPDLWQALSWEVLRWNLWLPVGTILVRWLRARPRSLPACAGACVLASAAHTSILLLIYLPMIVHVLTQFLAHRWFVLLDDCLVGVVVGALVIGIGRLAEQETRSAELEAQVAVAQLETLKMQLHPHFLFNTLNAIASLQLEDSETARRMIVRLAEFMRLTIDNSGLHCVPLEREIEFLSRYLEIEKLRFPNKLSISFAIADDTRDAQVPNLILQPLIENSIRHGIAKQTIPGTVEICSLRRNSDLILRVRDTGPGFATAAIREGVGLTNTRARLLRMYGSRASLAIQSGNGSGVLAELVMPLERSK